MTVNTQDMSYTALHPYGIQVLQFRIGNSDDRFFKSEKSESTKLLLSLDPKGILKLRVT